MPANTFAVFHFTGATTHDLTGGTGDAPVHRSAFFTNEKATQYVLGAVLGGLSFVTVLVNVTSFSFLSLYRVVILKSYDSAKVF